MPPAPTKPMIDEARTLYSNMKSSSARIPFAVSGRIAYRASCARLHPTLRTASTTSGSTPSKVSYRSLPR